MLFSSLKVNRISSIQHSSYRSVNKIFNTHLSLPPIIYLSLPLSSSVSLSLLLSLSLSLYFFLLQPLSLSPSTLSLSPSLSLSLSLCLLSTLSLTLSLYSLSLSLSTLSLSTLSLFLSLLLLVPLSSSHILLLSYLDLAWPTRGAALWVPGNTLVPTLLPVSLKLTQERLPAAQ